MNTAKIELLLFALTCLCRFATLRQGAQLLSVSTAQMRTILKQFEAQKLLEALPRVTACEPPTPEIIYHSAAETPNFGRLAWQLGKSRGLVMKRLDLIVATPLAARWTGGVRPNFTRPNQVVHDLNTTEIVLTQRSTIVDLGQCWRGDDYLAARGIRCGSYVPDLALVVNGRIQHAVDYAAGYGVQRLRAIDKNCRDHGVSYELWR